MIIVSRGVLPSRFMVSCNSLNSCSTVKGGVGSSIGSSYIQYDTNIKRIQIIPVIAKIIGNPFEG